MDIVRRTLNGFPINIFCFRYYAVGSLALFTVHLVFETKSVYMIQAGLELLTLLSAVRVMGL